ncbi:hypothetical protein PAESOLCIP111_04672 [Paenibacillus solanacearum]|uniref:PadR family transcriptional regulator n=1 Tax=Paenibacillus solanacearum TaxID=2048548 RepID=A0A916K8J9_9BACL|nr:PadR family transcriptional regulator [Paenibacillus solanacearum]CAG7644343.1 hypothetical protein PAESOLCIP111_04672 [Paenibacillus solanacearum]
MSSIQYVLLSLLAREPLSGYDMKQQINGRISFFYKISNNQLYPTLSKLETEEYIRLQSHERESYRPAKKIYTITDKGLDSLKAWVISPSEPGAWDEFLLKQYSSWLVEPEVMIAQLVERRKEHEARLEEYTVKAASLRGQEERIEAGHPLFSSIGVIEMGILFERGYADWCDKMIGWLRENRI